MGKIQVLVAKTTEYLSVKEIEDTFAAITKEVDGYITIVKTGVKDILLICDEEGIPKGKKPSIEFKGKSFLGTVVFARMHSTSGKITGINVSEIEMIRRNCRDIRANPS